MPKVRFYIDIQDDVPIEHQERFLSATPCPLVPCSSGFTRYTFTVELPGPKAIPLHAAVSPVRRADEEE